MGLSLAPQRGSGCLGARLGRMAFLCRGRRTQHGKFVLQTFHMRCVRLCVLGIHLVCVARSCLGGRSRFA